MIWSLLFLACGETGDSSDFPCQPLGDLNSGGQVGQGGACEVRLCVDPSSLEGYFQVRGEELWCDGMCGIDDNCLAYEACGWDDEALAAVGC